MFLPTIDENSQIPKFQQIIDAYEDAVRSNILAEGDAIASVNVVCRECHLSRDTVFKAYTELKNRRLIEAVKNKGYFVSRDTSRIFLFLDTFKAYKEELYGAFRSALPGNFSVDIHFHHYNVRVFEDILRNAIGKYSHYIVMPFKDPTVNKVLKTIPSEKLLCIDWNIHVPKKASFLCQDFGQSLYDALVQEVDSFRKYERFIYLYPETTYHPKESIDYFKQFCNDYTIAYEVLYDSNQLKPKSGDVYLLVSDRNLSMLLEMTQERDLKIGSDIGVVSYNETPMRKYVKEGITVVSTDFKAMGTKAAQFVISEEKVQEYLPTSIIKRASL